MWNEHGAELIVARVSEREIEREVELCVSESIRHAGHPHCFAAVMLPFVVPSMAPDLFNSVTPTISIMLIVQTFTLPAQFWLEIYFAAAVS